MKAKDDKGRWAVQMPHRLFDCLREMYNLKTDAELAQFLSARTPMISKVRNKIIRITPKLILEIHKQTKMPIEKIEEMSK